MPRDQAGLADHVDWEACSNVVLEKFIPQVQGLLERQVALERWELLASLAGVPVPDHGVWLLLTHGAVWLFRF